MSCVKTGAIIYFENYGMTVRGDIHLVGDTNVIRWNTKSCEYDTSADKADVVVRLVNNSEKWYHDKAQGMTIVPTDYLSW